MSASQTALRVPAFNDARPHQQNNNLIISANQYLPLSLIHLSLVNDLQSSMPDEQWRFAIIDCRIVDYVS